MKTVKISAMLLTVVLAAGLTSCKDRETTTEETMTETTMETDTMSMPPVTEEIPADTTTTGMPSGAASETGSTPAP